MKKRKLYCLIALTSAFLTACKTEHSEETELKKISQQRDSVIERSRKKDSALSSFFSSFTEIEKNLADIKEKEEYFSVSSKINPEISGNVREEINQNIQIINDLMSENRKKINLLNAQVRQNNYKIDQLNGLVTVLVSHINDKNLDLMSLNRLLAEKIKLSAQLNTAMIDFGIQSAAKSDTINQKNAALKKSDEELGRAYSAFGIDIVPEVMPEFPGGPPEMNTYFKTRLRYPEKESKDKLSGTVYVELIVEKDGQLGHLQAKKEVEGAPGLTKEAMRLIREMPKWKPGREKGKAVRVDLVLPVVFSLK